MKRTVCPVCKGKGYWKEKPSALDWLCVPITFGFSLLQRPRRCNMCSGEGMITTRGKRE